MRALTIACLLPLALAACGSPVPPISPNERAQTVAELIETDGSCAGFRARLSQPFTDRREIDAIYDEAKASGCIKRDI